MNHHNRVDYLTSDGVLKLLSDDEAASVSNAESTDSLSEGEEYFDLERLDQGVQRASGPGADMGRVLPKNAVHEETWSKIVALVDGSPGRGAT